MTKGQGETGTEEKEWGQGVKHSSLFTTEHEKLLPKKVLQHQLEPEIAKNIFIGDQTKGTDAPSKIAFN